MPIADLADRLHALTDSVVSTGDAETFALEQIHPRNIASAQNLLHYLALRSSDLRHLQTELARHGLSSLGRAEAHVEATLRATSRAADALAGHLAPGSATRPDIETDKPMVGFDEGPEQLEANAEALFGPRMPGRSTRIMVTLPSEAATDPALVAEFAEAGASVFRINSAHDDPEAWAAMVAHLRLAEERTGRRLVVVVDLAGPKLRTGPIAPGPSVIRIKPERDQLGRATVAATVLLSPEPAAADDGLPHDRLPVDDLAWLARRTVGERITFTDARGSSRRMVVTGHGDGSITCTLPDTAYLTPGTELRAGDDRTTIGDLPPVEQGLRIHPGDRIRLVADLSPADAAVEPPTIGCTLPEALRDAVVGDRVSLDDGKIAGRIVATDMDSLEIEVMGIAPGGAWLKAEKGINLPDTDLDLPAMTVDDRAILPFVIEHADAVDLSFVRTAADVQDLREELARLGQPDFPVIVKLETMTAFRNLPDILLAGMASPHLGVMIARGDLAVEAGYVRMGELQEEIMWICEAAHVPVVWATQVLEDLAKKGRPARAEVTDAAMSGRAECVMLNKGPYIPTAIRFLDAILTRMEGHQDKKSSLLRRLRLSGRGSDL